MKLLASIAVAGALVGAGVGAWARPGDADGARTVSVMIRHSRFSPSRMSFAHGERVRFVVTNTDPIDHEFLLGDAARQAAHERGTEQAHGAIPGEVTVPAGETRETTFTFVRSTLLGCHAPGHYAYGMRGAVTVR